MKIKAKTIESSYRRKIAQYDLNGHLIKIWDGYSVITKLTGYSQSNICHCCYGRIKQAYGFRWSFV